MELIFLLSSIIIPNYFKEAKEIEEGDGNGIVIKLL